MALTPKQARFVAEYLVDLNATQAAIRAGYSPKTAYAIGGENLSKPEIADAIATEQAKRAIRVEVTQDEVLTEVLRVMRSDVRDFEITAAGTLVLREGAPDDAWRAVSSVKQRMRLDAEGAVTHEVEFKLWDKIAAIKLAGQHIGMFKERVEHSGSVTLEQLLAGSLQR